MHGERALATWVVLVDYNGLEDTRKCLVSLDKAGKGAVSTVVVDNASRTDVAAALASEFPGCHWLRNSVNGGWAGGNNSGIRHALEHGARRIVLLNNDTIVAPDFFTKLGEAVDARPGFGIVGPVINFMDEPDTLMTDGVDFNGPREAGFFQRHAVPVSDAIPPHITEVDIINGCCMMVDRAVFERIGLIDERFFLIHEESDFCLRARRAGFRCGVVGSVLVWHKGSSAFKRTGKRLQRYYDTRNIYLLLHKHPPRGSRRRGPWRSRLEFLKYAYYRYAIERENGQEDAADAVLQGLCDAVAGRYGPFKQHARPAAPLLRSLFEFCRRCQRTSPPTPLPART